MFSKLKEKIVNFVDLRIIPIIITWTIFFIKFKPMLIISKYNHSNADDFWMSSHVHHIWDETHSVWATIGKAFESAVNLWKYWDGCFLSMFIGSMPPVVFHEEYYKYTFVVLAGALIIAFMAFLFVLLVRVCKFDIRNYLIICPVILIIVTNMTASAKDAFYWWVGGINYTLLTAIFILAQAFILEFMVSRNIPVLIIGTILSFMVGVGNLLSGLVNPVVLVLEFVVYVYIHKRKGLIFAIPTVAGIAGLLCNVLAPGNLIRGGSGVFSNAVFGSIWGTIVASTNFLPQFYRTSMGCMALLVLIVIIDGMKDRKLEFKFKYPAAFTVLTYLVYCATFTPVIYANSAFYGRCKNVSFFMFVIFVIVNFIYWTGWFFAKFPDFEVKKINKVLLYAATIAVIYVSVRFAYKFDSYSAQDSLKTGQAQSFDNKVNERFELYYNDDIKDVEVEPIDWIPPIFYWDDDCLTDIAYYFYKDSIKVIE